MGLELKPNAELSQDKTDGPDIKISNDNVLLQ